MAWLAIQYQLLKYNPRTAGQPWHGGNTMEQIQLMNPKTGTVQTKKEWQDDFENTTPELWGGENFDDANLIHVIFADDEWKEV